MGKGGGGGPTQTTSTSNTSNIPEYAQPYVETMLGATQKQLYKTDDSGGITGFQPYKAFGGTYDAQGNMTGYDAGKALAGFTPAQQQAQRGIMSLQTPGQFADASNITQQAALGSLGAQYNPMSAGYNQVRGAQTQAAQMGNAPMSEAAMGYGQNMQAATGSGQDMQAAQMGGSPQAQAAAMQAAQLGNTPLAQAAQFGGPQDVNAQNVGTQDYTGGNVSKYMNPYLQSALDPQLAEVQRQYDITGTQQRSGAAKSGAFGGSREALMSAENQRNAGIAKNQILSQGYNQAFNNAQQQFNAQQQANLQAQQANQGANLQAGLANQSMGYNTGAQNAQLQQQANLANQGLMGQYGLQQGQFGQAANQFNAGNQQQANLANQALAGQYGMQQGQFNQAANQANQASRNQFGMANLANQQQANQANQAAQNQFGMANLSNRQQSGLANQALMGQYGMQQGQFGQAANLANQQSRNQANLANQQAQLAAQGQNIGQQQFGANYRMQGLGQAGQMAGQLAGIGGQQLQAQQGIYNAQNAVGGQQQQLEQQKINQALQDYANAQQYPIMQLGTMSNMLRGLPMQAQTTQQYQAQANPITQGIGALGAGASLYNATKAEGGVVKAAKGGIMSYDVGGAVYSDLLEMEPEQLSKYIKEASSPRVKSMAEQILREKTGKASGGIMRFARGEDVELGEDYKPGEKVEGSTSYRPTVTLPNKPADPVVSRFHSVLKNEMPAALRAPDYTAAKPPEKQLSSQDAAIAEQLKRDLLTQVPEGRTPAQPISPSSILAASPASPPPAGASPAGASPAAPPRANAPIPANRVNTIVNQNPQLKDAMGSNTPDKNAKETMDFYRGLLKELKVDENKPTDEYAGMSTEGIANKLETDRSKFLGPNPSGKQRESIMAEKANAQDEAKRTQAMRMAEFFAMWGSTPGNTIVAGLNAMKNKIPDFITDRKEATKIRRDMDKSIAELDRVDYLEKAGRFDEAGKLRETSRKHGMEWATKMVDLSSRFAIAAGQDVSAEKRTRMTGEYALEGDRLKAAAIRDGNQLKMSADLKTIEGQFAKANTALETARKNFSKELEGDENYRRSLVIVDSANATEKQKIAAREYIKSKKTEADTELGRLKNDVEYYRELRDTYRGTTPGASTSKTPTSKETVNVGGVTYSKPPDMTNDDWAKYKKDVGAR